jgi:hypothetical protein
MARQPCSPDDFGPQLRRREPSPEEPAARARSPLSEPARQTEVVFRFKNGWSVVRVPRSRWADEGRRLGHCFQSPEGRALYDAEPAERGSTPWTVLSLRTSAGDSMQTIGFTVDTSTNEVGFHASLIRQVQQGTTRKLVSEFLTALDLGPWKTICRHGPSGDHEAEFEWGGEDYNARTGQHRCPVCGREYEVVVAPLTAQFTEVLGEAMAQRAAEAEQGLGDGSR